MAYLLLLVSGLSMLVSALTWMRAPDYVWTWKLAILAGEYGHWLVGIPLVIAVVAWCGYAGAIHGVVLALCAVATVGFLRPTWGARQLMDTLPVRLTTGFRPGQTTVLPEFNVARLYVGSPKPTVRVTTEVFARRGETDLALDYYWPVRSGNTQRLAPCVVVIHGGGWDGGDRAQLGTWNHLWAARGYAVAAVSYRLAPQSTWPAQREDVLAAIAWLKVHAERLAIDQTRLVVLGRSAGGQLATAVAYGANDPAIRGVIALYGPHDMPFAWSVSREDDALNSIKLFRQYFGGAPDTPERRVAYEAASGQLLVRADSPPTLLVHGARDTLAWDRHSERLAARLAELRVPHVYLRLPWATHGFDFNRNGPGGQLTDAAISRFLAATLQN